MSIVVTPSSIPDVLIIEPKIFADERGWFFESVNERDFSAALGQSVSFVQDNHSMSKRGVLRGLHYQTEQTQAKLVRVVRGSVFDVAVDLRESSKTFGKWVGIELSAENKKQMWIPKGFAHGFLVLSNEAEFFYKTTDYWHAESEKCIIWNDSKLNIKWPDIGSFPVLSIKDATGASWWEAKRF
jgi:dTDP-4-dehydrorhamnose 3,5-epimerase